MKRELSIAIAGREVDVVVEPNNGGWRLVVDGVVRNIDAQRVRPGTWSLIVDGRSFLVDLEPRAQATAASAGLIELVAHVVDARRQRLARAAPRHIGAVQGEELRAPIAGKVVKILVEEGGEVAAGQAVVVLEAMKMENELVAERGGKVQRLHKAAGQSVETGDLLVSLS